MSKPKTSQLANVPEHPSRTTPQCVNCQYCLIDRPGYPRCNHPAAPVDIVSGYPKLLCERARSDDPLHTEAICRGAGVLFEPMAPQGTTASEALFMDLWLGAALELVVAPYTAEQLHRAYLHWATDAGHTFLASRSAFTARAKTHLLQDAGAEPRAKLIDITVAEGDRRRSYRCWVPQGHTVKGDGAWLAPAAAALEAYQSASGSVDRADAMSCATATTVSGVQPSGMSA